MAGAADLYHDATAAVRSSDRRRRAGHNLGHSAVKPRVSMEGALPARDLESGASGPPRRLLGVEEAAAYLSLSVWTIREMEWRGDLRRVRLPRIRRLLFDRADLDRLVEEGKGGDA